MKIKLMMTQAQFDECAERAYLQGLLRALAISMDMMKSGRNAADVYDEIKYIIDNWRTDK